VGRIGPGILMDATATEPLAGGVRPDRREPLWSGFFTRRLARLVPFAWRPAVVAAIKALHTCLFVAIGTAIALFVFDGLRGKPSRRTAAALGVATGEAAVYLSNNQVCPFTPLAEELGAEHGAVADLFLPEWASRRIPLVSTTVLALGIALNARALLARRNR
jgi:hypothetical protein